MTGVNPPIEIINMSNEQDEYKDLDFVGFTCIESDVIYRNFNGKLAIMMRLLLVIADRIP